MKTTLTIEQSATLINKCIGIHYASGWQNDSSLEAGGGFVFTIADMFSFLPQAERDLGRIMIDFDVERSKWTSTYEFLHWVAREDELIDSLYKLTLHLLDNHVKLD